MNGVAAGKGGAFARAIVMSRLLQLHWWDWVGFASPIVSWVTVGALESGARGKHGGKGLLPRLVWSDVSEAGAGSEPLRVPTAWLQLARHKTCGTAGVVGTG